MNELSRNSSILKLNWLNQGSSIGVLLLFLSYIISTPVIAQDKSLNVGARVGQVESYLATNYLRNGYLESYKGKLKLSAAQQALFHQRLVEYFRLVNKPLIEQAKYSNLSIDSLIVLHQNKMTSGLDSLLQFYKANPNLLVTSTKLETPDEDPLMPPQPNFCDNMDLESCNFSQWELATGKVNNVPYGFTNRVVTASYNTSIPVDDGLQHYIVNNSAWLDPTVSISCVKPGGSCSAVLGDKLGDGYNAASMRRTFTVTPDNYFFSYSYAVIMEDPANVHTPGERPYFTVRMFDQQGDSLDCSKYEVYSGDGNPAWQNSPTTPTGTPIVFTDWTDAFIPLEAYIGQNVTIEFSVGDCNLGGHAAYAYVEANCGGDIIVTDTFTCPGIPVTLTAPAGASSYLWNTGETTRVIQVADSGLYTVEMGSTADDNCKAFLSKRIYLKEAPLGDFTADTVCLTNPTTFSDRSSAATTGLVNWEWDFQNDGVYDATGQVMSYTFPDAGNQTVRLQVEDANGCKHDTTYAVFVYDKPYPSFTWNPACEGDSTVLSNTSTGQISQVWDLNNDGTNLSTQLNVKALYTPAGTHQVKLVTVNENNCIDSVVNDIVINPIPSANFSDLNLCFPEQMTFTDLSSVATGDVVTWLWEFGDGGIAFDQNPTYSYASFDSYEVKLTVLSDSGCIDTIRKPVSYYAKPSADFTVNDTCKNEVFNLIDLSTSATSNIVDWKWDISANGSVEYTTQNASHTLGIAGIDSVRLIVTSAQDCKDTVVKSLEIFELPVADFNALPVCLNDSSVLISTSTGDVIDSWKWDVGVNGSVENTNSNFKIQLDSSGATNIELWVKTDKGCMDSVAKPILVNPLPAADFKFENVCFPEAMLFEDSSTIKSGSVVHLEWDFGDGSGTSAAINPSYNYAAYGTYGVRLIAFSDSGCVDTIFKTVTSFEKPLAGFEVVNECANEFFEFTNSSDVTTSAIVKWGWDVGVDGSIDYSTENMSHQFTQDGQFSVRLYVETLEGCKDTATEDLIVYPLPTALFTVSEVCLNDSNAFIYGGSGNIVLYEWDFNADGVTESTDMNPVYAFANDGSFPVELKVTTNQGCLDSVTIDAVVFPLPVASFSTDFICEPETNAFANSSAVSSGSIASNTWDFGDGSNSAASNPSHQYAVFGSYDVKLLVGTNEGCLDSITKTVVYYEKPVAVFSLKDTCMLTEVSFEDESTVGSSVISAWNWDVESNSSIDYTTKNASHAYAVDGTYNATLEVITSEGCRDTAVVPVQIYPLPTPSFTFNNVCVGFEMDFTSTSVANLGAITDYTWSFGDGQSANGSNVSNLYANSGTYMVNLSVVTDLNCVNDIDQAVTVYASPDAEFTVPEVCVGTASTFTNTSNMSDGSPSSNIVSHVWDFGDGSAGSGKLPTHLYNQIGTYDVKLTTTTRFGCVDSLVRPAVINAYPVIGMTSSLPRGCTEWCVDFQDASTVNGGTIQDYYWTFESESSSKEANPRACFENNSQDVRSFTVDYSVVSDKGCQSDTSYPMYVTVYPRAVAEFAFLPRVTDINDPYYYFENQSIGISYAWEFGDGDTSSLSDPHHKYQEAGVYEVTLIANNMYSCPDTVMHPVKILPRAAYYVPNAISTDGDGLNEIFYVYGYNIVEFEMRIYDRWGLHLFTSNDINVGWDGTYKGEKVQQDVYVYKAVLTDILGETHKLVGTVTVVK